MAPAIRSAVVKSGLRSATRTWVMSSSANWTSRSMIAPAGMRAAVGTPRVTVSASPCASNPPALSAPWATA
jgi:hypothetical protein